MNCGVFTPFVEYEDWWAIRSLKQRTSCRLKMVARSDCYSRPVRFAEIRAHIKGSVKDIPSSLSSGKLETKPMQTFTCKMQQRRRGVYVHPK